MGKAQAYEVERRLHRKLRRHHLRGEWFKKQSLRLMSNIEGLGFEGKIDIHADDFQFNWRYGSESIP